MKKVFTLSLITLIIIFIYRNMRKEEFDTDRFESYSQKESSPESNNPEKTPHNTIEIEAPPQKRTLPKKRTASSSAGNYPVLNQGKEDKHVAQTDQQGKIYPRTVKIDDEMIIAYGDLIVGSTQDLEDYQSGDKMLNIPPPVLWPEGSIPFEMDNSLDDPNQIETIKKVMNSLNKIASLNFHPRKANEDNYVLFKKGTQHCYANIGFRLGVTQVSLSSGCGEKEIYHEIFHVLGFFHEQNRTDRDDYIEVLWENIDEENWPQFEKFTTKSYPEAFQDMDSIPFEFNSIMLYDSRAFSNTNDYSMVRIDGTPFLQSGILRPVKQDEERLKALYP